MRQIRPLWTTDSRVLGRLAWDVLTDRFDVVAALGYVLAAVPLLALAVIDARTHRLPDRITLPLIPGSLLITALASASTHDWPAFGRSAAAGLTVFAAGFAIMFASPGGAGLGFGDVKLGASLGVLTGWLSWGTVVGAIALAFLGAGLWAAALVLTRRANRHTHLAFGPFLIGGAVLAIVAA
ncbi:prepilin peptidase [Flexivirga meconopsidis]|uniref:prepilin peptidase n=1 Tax=Flexivirga meconopsidis TaxID=2977121 RepID=UPI00223F713B